MSAFSPYSVSFLFVSFCELSVRLSLGIRPTMTHSVSFLFALCPHSFTLSISTLSLALLDVRFGWLFYYDATPLPVFEAK